MGTQLFNGVVFVAIVQDRPIIAAKDDQCLFVQIQSLQRCHQFANAPIELHNRIRSRPALGLTLKTFMGHSWYMQIMRRKEQEEWLVSIRLHPFHGFVHPAVRQIFVSKTSGMATSIETNAADAIVNGGVVSA